MRVRVASRVFGVLVVLGTLVASAIAAPACSSDTPPREFEGADGSVPEGGEPDAVDPGDGGSFDPDTGLPIETTRDPVDCNEAKTTKSYVGCDYWPTVTANNVWSIFDFAVVVANTGSQPASITVTGPSATNKQVTVPAGQLKKIYLPWVASLKGQDTSECAESHEMTASVSAPGGAYHLVSSTPVIVYQFNALEYKGQGGEAPDGGTKSWAACPGSQICATTPGGPAPAGCLSFSNDASLLLPSTAMTGNYRIAGPYGFTIRPSGTDLNIMGPQFAVTGTEAGTVVTVKLGPKATVLAGGGVPATAPGGTFTFNLGAGDVVEVVGAKGRQSDLSGSLVQANKPVQVITGIPCLYLPDGVKSCDHLEESVFPAETLGRHYAVTVPTSPNGNVVGHIVRMFGNVDGTKLTYVPAKPPLCPTTLEAGEVVDCGPVGGDFEVKGDHEFSVGSFMLGGDQVDPSGGKGDPSLTFTPSIEQFRTKYLFLAPDDYDVSFVDIIGTAAASPVVDGAPVQAPFQAIGSGPFGVFRVKLGAGQNGAHTLTSTSPVGIQVMGYGSKTSYHYPGGLNLKLIAPPPK